MMNSAVSAGNMGLAHGALRRLFRFLLRGAAFVAALLPCGPLSAGEILAAVAANFSAPMKRIASEFEKETGHKVLISNGTVGKFYSQIKNGAGFEVLVSSDRETPDKLVHDGLAVESTRFTYAIGKLVLWSADKDKVDSRGEVLKSGEFQYLALANPKFAVYGAAGETVLRKLGLLDAVKTRIVTAENITQAYQFVATGNADLGFVALSQVIGKDGKIAAGSAWIVPQDHYQPIRQDVILLAAGKDKAPALALVNYFRTEKARSIIRAYGYDF
ncbi:MAG TPA: molybdate ABC transporter substrate-binding protein [Methylocella sp.]|nr:molybdate ABC transporter substrate-binding protein [Methylocella sp.]